MVGDKINYFIVVGRNNYPLGSAPVSRIHLYCKALKEKNVECLVLNLSSNLKEKQKFSYIGRFEGVAFLFVQKRYIRVTSFFKRNWLKIKEIFVCLNIFSRKSRKNHNLVVLLYGTTYFQELVFSIYLRLKGVKVIKDISEAPLFERQGKSFISLRRLLFRLFTLPLYDRIIVISTFLWDYIGKLYSTRKMIKIPILVDFDRFKINIPKPENTEFVFMYSGYMGGNKDGLVDLISAFAIVCKSQNNVKLKLLGTAPKNDLEKIKQHIKTLGLEEKVELLGRIEYEDIPSYLLQADCLVLARPDNIQARAGFPTKLGEYLAACKPVVITKTGEIPNYLTHKLNAYIAEPGNIEDIANKMIEAINDENKAIVAQNGYELAMKNFNYKIYSELLFEKLYIN